MADRLNIGIVGAGVFGAYHGRKFAERDDARVAGVFDLDRERAETLGRSCSTGAAESLEALFDACDAVAVTSPASSHFSVARAALEAGKHVLVEKPLALSGADADALVELAARKNLILQVGHQERYVFDAVGLLRQDRRPLKIDCVRRGPRSGRCEDVSVVFDLMVHDIDLVRKLTAAPLQSLTAKGERDHAEAEVMLEDNVVISLRASRKADARERRINLVYDDGVVEFDFIERTLVNSTPADLSNVFSSDADCLAIRDPLAYGAGCFLEAVRNGATPIVDGRDGRDAVEWAALIEQALGPGAFDVADEERLRA